MELQESYGFCAFITVEGYKTYNGAFFIKKSMKELCKIFNHPKVY